MSGGKPDVTMTVRIPGRWATPVDLMDALPIGYSLDDVGLKDPNGQTFEMFPVQADNEFAGVFESTLRRPAEPSELEAARTATVMIILRGAAGSLETCLQTVRAAASVVMAGGAGVFIDNSGTSFGGSDWLAMADDGSPEAISFACVGLAGDDAEAFTTGMHLLGRRDLVMSADRDLEVLVEAIPYVCDPDKPVDTGHVLVLGSDQSLRLTDGGRDPFPTTGPTHNPHGRWRLVDLRDEAAAN